MGAGAVNIIMLPSLLIPVTWFPEHKGLVGFNTKSITINVLGQAKRLQQGVIHKLENRVSPNDYSITQGWSSK